VPSTFDISPPLNDERTKRRLASNQALARLVNEAMRSDRPDEAISFSCECGQIGCNQLIELTRGEYDQVRGDARRFAVVGRARDRRDREHRRATRPLRRRRSAPPSRRGHRRTDQPPPAAPRLIRETSPRGERAPRRAQDDQLARAASRRRQRRRRGAVAFALGDTVSVARA
jgi:hypothetical protein